VTPTTPEPSLDAIDSRLVSAEIILRAPVAYRDVSAPKDPVCPACGEPVGATSQYCMHCDSEFDAPVDAGNTEERAEPERDGGNATAASANSTTDASTATGGSTAPSASTATGGSTAPSASTTTGVDEGGFDVLQFGARLLAVLLVVVVGIVTTLALLIVTSEATSLWLPLLLVSFLGIVTAGVLVARQDSGIDALADALYVTAAALVGLPIAFFLLLPSPEPIVDRLVAGVIGAVFGSFVAVPMFVVGWWLQPDDE
jgi:hypothetical protein